MCPSHLSQVQAESGRTRLLSPFTPTAWLIGEYHSSTLSPLFPFFPLFSWSSGTHTHLPPYHTPLFCFRALMCLHRDISFLIFFDPAFLPHPCPFLKQIFDFLGYYGILRNYSLSSQCYSWDTMGLFKYILL